MDSTKFIKDQLKSIASSYTKFQFTYWYNADFLNHFIEVIPSSFQENLSFIESELDFIDAFYELFPSESLSFVTMEELSSFSKIDKVLTIPIKMQEWFNDALQSARLNEPELVCTKHNYSLAA